MSKFKIGDLVVYKNPENFDDDIHLVMGEGPNDSFGKTYEMMWEGLNSSTDSEIIEVSMSHVDKDMTLIFSIDSSINIKSLDPEEIKSLLKEIYENIDNDSWKDKLSKYKDEDFNCDDKITYI